MLLGVSIPRSPLIFTPDVVAKAEARGRRYSGPVLDRLVLQGDWAAPQREQLERIAARIAESKRQRVLGMLQSEGASGAINQLLLAATLEDNGWAVEHEPEVQGGTPDLRVQKAGASFIIEVVRVEVVEPTDAAIARVRDALHEHTTLRPISINSVHVDGSASLKPFVLHVLGLSSAPAEVRQGQFRSEGVYVAFDLHPAMPEAGLVLLTWSPGARFINDVPDIRGAIARKVKAYKVPLIVAVDLVNVTRPIAAAEAAVYGTQAYSMPVNLSPEQSAQLAEQTEGSWIRLADGPLNAPGSAGTRARDRLIGVLPFYVGLDEQLRYAVNTALLGNPLSSTRESLTDFSPIPHCVPTAISQGKATMTWLNGTGTPMDYPEWMRWSWAPAA